jgi:hypothetical protein
MISILFASKNSVYKTIPGLDVWDLERNALNWPGGNPGIFHPPCRLFCALKHFSTAPESEKELAHWSVKMVREHGGVLEHPARSTLFQEAGLPLPGYFPDQYGLTIQVDQFQWGHRASKPTWLYICGTQSLPEFPAFTPGRAPALQSNSRQSNRFGRKLLSRPARSATPINFALWLVELAGRVEGVPA